MAVGWIDRVFNNTNFNWYMKSIDNVHNGKLKGGGHKFKLDDKKFHRLKPSTEYDADWCGIPWFHNGDHFKVISKDKSKGVRFYQSEVNGKNWILYENHKTGERIGRLTAPNGLATVFHCYLRIKDDRIYFDIVNSHGEKIPEIVYEVYNEFKEWVKITKPDDFAKLLATFAG